MTKVELDIILKIWKILKPISQKKRKKGIIWNIFIQKNRKYIKPLQEAMLPYFKSHWKCFSHASIPIA